MLALGPAEGLVLGLALGPLLELRGRVVLELLDLLARLLLLLLDVCLRVVFHARQVPGETAGQATIVTFGDAQARPSHDPPRLRQVRARRSGLRPGPARAGGAARRAPHLCPRR